MDIQNFKDQHVRILQGVADLRKLAQAGIKENAQAIASGVISLSSIIKMHLAVEDRTLYPAVQQLGNENLAAMGKQYQDEMQGIAQDYAVFSRRWNTRAQVEQDPEGFRADANTVLKLVHTRMQRENTQFYPAIEAA